MLSYFWRQFVKFFTDKLLIRRCADVVKMGATVMYCCLSLCRFYLHTPRSMSQQLLCFYDNDNNCFTIIALPNKTWWASGRSRATISVARVVTSQAMWPLFAITGFTYSSLVDERGGGGYFCFLILNKRGSFISGHQNTVSTRLWIANHIKVNWNWSFVLLIWCRPIFFTLRCAEFKVNPVCCGYIGGHLPLF